MEIILEKRFHFNQFYLVLPDVYRRLPDFSLLGITVSFSTQEIAINMITPPVCIIFRAEADSDVKTASSQIEKPPETKTPADS